MFVRVHSTLITGALHGKITINFNHKIRWLCAEYCISDLCPSLFITMTLTDCSRSWNPLQRLRHSNECGKGEQMWRLPLIRLNLKSLTHTYTQNTPDAHTDICIIHHTPTNTICTHKYHISTSHSHITYTYTTCTHTTVL